METLRPILDEQDTFIRVLSPAVGYYARMPEEDALLSGGSVIGTLTVLNRVYQLQLPPGLQGRVKYGGTGDHVVAVEFGQELFCLHAQTQQPAGKQAAARAQTLDTDAAANEHLIQAFTTGIFYRRPAPDAPPYVNEGDEIEKGCIVGLIEIMKTFNYILFQGSDVVDRGIVRKIYANDGQEVKIGQLLFRIEKKGRT